MGYQYNYNKLKGLIKEHCGNQQKYAQYLGISPTTLYTRLHNQTPFTQNEIVRSCELFGVNDPLEADRIFFNRI